MKCSSIARAAASTAANWSDEKLSCTRTGRLCSTRCCTSGDAPVTTIFASVPKVGLAVILAGRRDSARVVQVARVAAGVGSPSNLMEICTVGGAPPSRRIMPPEHAPQRGRPQFLRPAEHARVSDLTLGVERRLQHHRAADRRPNKRQPSGASAFAPASTVTPGYRASPARDSAPGSSGERKKSRLEPRSAPPNTPWRGSRSHGTWTFGSPLRWRTRARRAGAF